MLRALASVVCACLLVALTAHAACSQTQAKVVVVTEGDSDAPQLRLAAGPAYIAALQSLGAGQDGSIEGFGFGFDFALGAPLSEDLALGADLALVRSGSAEHGVLESTVFTALHLGAGFDYWLVPRSTFLGGSLGLARSSVEGDRLHLGAELPDNDPSDLGLGLHACLGQQLRLGSHVGAGVLLSLLASFANNPIGGHDGLRTVLAATLGLTATLQ